MYGWACEIDLSGNRLKNRGITSLASINCHRVSDLLILLQVKSFLDIKEHLLLRIYKAEMVSV